jgi:hypothetical protein
MDLNGIIFPSPKFDYSIEGYEKDLIFIPKKNSNDTIERHIPCLFLQAKLRLLSKHYLIFFHGNAEDIFIAKDIADKIRDNLYVK